jgi:hypothetical protein
VVATTAVVALGLVALPINVVRHFFPELGLHVFPYF